MEEDDVVILNNGNFNDFVSKYNFVLVQFYAPWCDHCKKLTPAYAKAALKLKSIDPPIPLAKVNATENTEIAKKFNVSGYPTIKFFINNNPIEYTGGRSSDEIIHWVQKKTGTTSKQFTTKAELQELRNDNRVLVVFFGHHENSNMYKVFKSTAAWMEGVQFSHFLGDSKEVFDNVYGDGEQLVLFKQFDEGESWLKGFFDQQRLRNFIEDNRYEVIMPFDTEMAIERIFGKETACMFLYTDFKDSEDITIFNKFAKNNNERIVFSKSAISSGVGQRLAEYVGITQEILINGSAIRIVNPKGGDLTKYVYSEKITEEG